MKPFKHKAIGLKLAKFATLKAKLTSELANFANYNRETAPIMDFIGFFGLRN